MTTTTHVGGSDLTVGQVIDATPLGAVLDTPVAQVLAGLNLPALPTLPQLPALPGLPALPALNFDVLLKPITDLLGTFGTGNLSTAAIDPSTILSGLSQLLESSLSLGTSALRALDGLWSGSAATTATAKSVRTGAETTAVATQGTGMSIDISTAAGIVGAGLATVQGIVVKTVGLLTMTIPLITTPVGQGMALGFIATGLAETTAAVAATRAQLLGPTSHMAANGAPVKISGAPSGTASPFATAANVLDSIGAPLKSVTSALTSVVGAIAPSTNGAHQTNAPRTTLVANHANSNAKVNSDNETRCPNDGNSPNTELAGGASLGGAGGSLGAGGVGSVAAPLAGRPTGATVTTEPAAAAPSQPTPRAAVAGASTMPAGMAPMTAAGIRGGSTSTPHTADYLVTAANGERVVGDIEVTHGPGVLTAGPNPHHDVQIDPALVDIKFLLEAPQGARGA